MISNVGNTQRFTIKTLLNHPEAAQIPKAERDLFRCLLVNNGRVIEKKDLAAGLGLKQSSLNVNIMRLKKYLGPEWGIEFPTVVRVSPPDGISIVPDDEWVAGLSPLSEDDSGEDSTTLRRGRIVALRAAGMTWRNIAKNVGKSQTTVKRDYSIAMTGHPPRSEMEYRNSDKGREAQRAASKRWRNSPWGKAWARTYGRDYYHHQKEDNNGGLLPNSP